MQRFGDSIEIYGLQPHTPPSVSDVPSESSVSSDFQVEPEIYNVEVVQFWQGEAAPLRPYPLQWAIWVRTGPRMKGHTYKLVGDQTNYAIDIRLHQPLENWNNLRGSHCVGTVSRKELDEMEIILQRVDIIHNIPWWNDQDWVDDALRYLKCWGFSNIIGGAELVGLQEEMCRLLECWPEINNAVQFVGYPDLACVLSNQRTAHAHRYFWMMAWIRQHDYQYGEFWNRTVV
ncbi:hypothetical protein EDD22DRAFT_1052141 [Suillus occidentalis]|nr:hypothetical protein EDD22DRAFT_1052141 [Suillus occidentalis]